MGMPFLQGGAAGYCCCCCRFPLAIVAIAAVIVAVTVAAAAAVPRVAVPRDVALLAAVLAVPHPRGRGATSLIVRRHLRPPSLHLLLLGLLLLVRSAARWGLFFVLAPPHRILFGLELFLTSHATAVEFLEHRLPILLTLHRF